MTGGYKIIDLKNVNLTGSPVVIDGIHESIESNYGKVIVFTGLVVNGVEWGARTTALVYENSAYIGVIGGTETFKLKLIKITDTDEVSVITEV